MSVQAMAWATRQKVGHPGRKLLLLLLADRADEAHSCFPGQALLAVESEQSVSTVARALERLEQDGFIRRERRNTKKGHRTSDRFFLPVEASQVEAKEKPNRQNGGQEKPNRQMVAPNRQKEGSYPSPVTEEPSVEPSVVEPSPAASAGEADGLFLVNGPERRTGADLVSAWVDAWSDARRGRRPDRAVVKRVAGACGQIAKTRTDAESWDTALAAAAAAGRQGRQDVVQCLADFRPVSYRPNTDDRVREGLALAARLAAADGLDVRAIGGAW